MVNVGSWVLKTNAGMMCIVTERRGEIPHPVLRAKRVIFKIFMHSAINNWLSDPRWNIWLPGVCNRVKLDQFLIQSNPANNQCIHVGPFLLQIIFYYCCRKGDPCRAWKWALTLTFRNELSKETHMLTKQETLLGRGFWEEGRRVTKPRRTTLPCGSQLRVLW